MWFSFVLLAAASAVSAAILPRASPLSPNLPASAFPHFHAISLEEAQTGQDLPDGGMEHNSTTHVMAFEAVASVQSASAASCSSNPNVRYEWRQFSASDRAAFMSAIKCLMGKPASGNFPPATSRYEDLVRLHQIYMPNIHNNPKFLIWHRYYLWTFEQVLRSECGFNRAFPWWDETLDAGNFAQSDMFTNTAYFGHLPSNNGQPVCITSGSFAGLTCHIGPGSSNTPHCLSRSVDESLTAQCNANFVNTCNARTSYADMESCAEGGPHANGHNGIGAVMSDVWASPSDPIFWMHHTFIDHGFRIWQNLDPSSRTTTINGDDHFGNPLTMSTVVSVGGIMPDVTIGQIMNTLSGSVIGGIPFCYKYTY